MKSKRFRFLLTIKFVAAMHTINNYVMQATCMYWSPEGSYLTTLDEDGTLKVSNYYYALVHV
jgi:hypothetical protein